MFFFAKDYCIFSESYIFLQDKFRLTSLTRALPPVFPPSPLSLPPSLPSPLPLNSNGNGDGDFIVETDTPHPSWQPGDLQPHPYLDLDSTFFPAFF